MNQMIGNQPSLAPAHSERGQGARQPPRKSVVATAERVTMLTYSARKNSANFSDEYSVWKPPTSSDSASARSNGARFGPPPMETAKIPKLTGRTQPYQPLSCAATMSAVDSEPE